jgi:hypothetical protein
VVHSTEPPGFLVPSPGTHTSQQYYSPQPPPPPPIRSSTRPRSNVTAPPPAPNRTFITQPAPPYEYAPPPLAPQVSRSSSHHSSIHDSGPSMQARPPPPTMPVPFFPNAAAPIPHHYGSSPPNMVYPTPQSVRSEGPPSNTQGWSYRGCSTLV